MHQLLTELSHCPNHEPYMFVHPPIEKDQWRSWHVNVNDAICHTSALSVITRCTTLRGEGGIRSQIWHYIVDHKKGFTDWTSNIYSIILLCSFFYVISYKHIRFAYYRVNYLKNYCLQYVWRGFFIRSLFPSTSTHAIYASSSDWLILLQRYIR